MAVLQGLVRKGIGGFYYVEAADAVYTCQARGILRQQKISPLAGDQVLITVQADGIGSLDEILPRRNALIRPPVANVDYLVLVASVAEPSPNTWILDKLIAIAEQQHIEPLVVINKSDLQNPQPLQNIYEMAGFSVYVVSAHMPESVASLKMRLQGKISAFAGNSGVGKSSLLNAMDPTLQLETGEISKKLGRGRHTTRMATLFRWQDGGYVVDTAGFSALETEDATWVNKDELPYLFREFAPFLGCCRYNSCAHIKETDCAVRKAVAEGVIGRSRFESYVAMYEEVKDKREWEKK